MHESSNFNRYSFICYLYQTLRRRKLIRTSGDFDIKYIFYQSYFHESIESLMIFIAIERMIPAYNLCSYLLITFFQLIVL